LRTQIESWTATAAFVGSQWDAEWENRRALFRRGEEVRAFAIGDLVGPDVVVGIEREAARLSRGQVIVRVTAAGAAEVVEAFAHADAARSWSVTEDPELRDAVFETLALLRDPEPRRAQVAVHALIQAGEAIVPYLALRAASLTPLPGWALALPDGRHVAPTREGVAVQAVLEVITGQRFGDVLDGTASDTEVLDAGAAWVAGLGY
jgi:hypothetical protein